MADEQVLARAAKDAFSDARRSDLSLVSTRESKRRPVNSHESLIARTTPVRRALLESEHRAAATTFRRGDGVYIYRLQLHQLCRLHLVAIRHIIVPRE